VFPKHTCAYMHTRMHACTHARICTLLTKR
jgi:hypothetical protein